MKKIKNKTHSTHGALHRSGKKGVAIYFTINLLFLIAVTLLSTQSGRDGHDPAFYLILLMALLSAPLLYVRDMAGSFIVLIVSSPVFFIWFGLSDVVTYFSDTSTQVVSSHSVITRAEIAILIAFLSLQIGCAFAVSMLREKSERWFVNDWDFHNIMIIGLLCFSVGLVATIMFQILSSGHQLGGSGKTGILTTYALIFGKMLGRLGEVFLSYACVKSQNKVVFIFVIALIVAKLPLAIILNSKEIGMSFVAIFFITAWLYYGRISWKIAIFGGLAAIFVFPLAYQYRTYMGEHNVSVGKTLENVSGHLEKALSNNISNKKEKGLLEVLSDGIESFSGRTNLKPSINLITARVGVDLPYQNGHTLAPILYVLIPSIILPNKPSVPVGQLFNQEFHLSEDPNTWVSTSFLGEFYWNYSWLGLVVGMLFVGFTYGIIGSIANLSKHKNIARILVLLSAIYMLVIKFETGFAQQYSLFIRTFIIIMILQLFFGRKLNKKAHGQLNRNNIFLTRNI